MNLVVPMMIHLHDEIQSFWNSLEKVATDNVRNVNVKDDVEKNAVANELNRLFFLPGIIS